MSPGSSFARLGRHRATAIVLALHLLLGLLATGVGLLGVLGFERALASALLTTATAPALGVAAARQGRREGGEPLRWWGASAAWSALALLPSMLCGLVFELWTTPCSIEQGALFFLLLGGGNLAFGTALGFAAALGFGDQGRVRFAPALIVFAVDLGWLASTLRRLYLEPQIFAYATPFGFWPGSLYDEALEIGPALWGFRGFGLLLSAGLLACARAFTDPARVRLRRRPSTPALALGLCLLGGAAATHAAGDRLGFDLDRADIERALSRRVETEHFVLHADPSFHRRDLRELALEHELSWRRLRAFFGVAPSAKITSFVYRDPEQKGRLMGAARTQIARPWIGEIHIHGAEVPHRVLEHELAHIFAGALAPPPFRVPLLFGLVPNIGLIEGLAVAADEPVRELTLHQWSAAMLVLDKLPSVARTLDPASFWAISSARAYTALGSFISWLVDAEGIEAVRQLYGGASFEAAVGSSADALEARWRAFLGELELGAPALRLAEHRFSRPSIFGKTCARDSANLAREAEARVAAGDLEGAAAAYEILYRRAGSDPAPLLALAKAHLRAGELGAARELAARAAATPGATARARARATELEGRIAWRSGDPDAARAKFAAVEALALGAASTRLQRARLEALARPEPARSDLLAYLGGELSAAASLLALAELARRRPEDALVRYLYARRLEAAGLPGRGRAWLDRPDALPSPELRDEARLTAGRLALAAGTATAALAAYERAEAQAEAEAARALARDGAARARFWAEVGARRE